MTDAKATIERVRKTAEVWLHAGTTTSMNEARDLFRVCRMAEEYLYLRRLILSQCKQTCKGRESYGGRLRHDTSCLADELMVPDLEIADEPEQVKE